MLEPRPLIASARSIKRGGGRRRIDHRIARHPEAAEQAGAEVRFQLPQPSRAPTPSASTPRSAKNRALRSTSAISSASVATPPRASPPGWYSTARGEVGGQLVPEVARVPAEGELRLGVVHRDDVPHPGGRRPRADRLAVHDHHVPPVARQRPGARRPHDPGADDDRPPPAHEPDPHPERVVGLEDQGRLGVDISSPPDRRDDLVRPGPRLVRPGEDAADDALLPVRRPPGRASRRPPGRRAWRDVPVPHGERS